MEGPLAMEVEETPAVDATKLSVTEPTVSSQERTTDEPSNHDHDETMARRPLCAPWTAATQCLHNGIKTTVVTCSVHAARHPKWYAGGITFVSLLLLTIGLLTNFELELDVEAILSPTGSQPAFDWAWVHSDRGFPNVTREVALLLHRHGDNVLTRGAMERVFAGVETIRQTPGYDELCQRGNYVNFEGDRACRVLSATQYFDSLESFQTQIHTDQDLRLALSPFEFANGSPVYHDAILGNYEKEENATLISAQSFLVIYFLPDIDGADAFEEQMFDRLDRLRRQWIDQDQSSGEGILEMDMVSIYATKMEYQRAIKGDLYLIPVVAFTMCSFVALVFFSYGLGHVDAKSRTTLGAASVFTITMSYVAGNGLMFICGVPFTPVTQILPFVVYGVGIDDTFIIMGAYLRFDPEMEIVERIRVTMEEVANSISLTTITTVFAFLLGLGSSLPGVKWLCLYAFTTISIDFYYQITLFIAFIVFDEQRIQAGRRDICIWLPERDKKLDADDNKDDNGEVGPSPEHSTTEGLDEDVDGDNNCHRMSIPDRFMSKYADFLLRPEVKGLVLFLFAALLACCTYSVTLLKQEFKVGDFVPDDSYLKDVAFSLQNYASVVRPIAVYFRNIDQTDPAMQAQMVRYVNELESLPEISGIEVDVQGIQGVDKVKPFCWVRDAQNLAGNTTILQGLAFLQNLTFTEQLDFALKNPTVRELYGQDIIRDETGNITASRCWLFLTDIDLDAVAEQIVLLHAQRKIGAIQPVNQGRASNQWSFFFYDEILFYWEAYDIAIRELISTIVSGVIAVTVITWLLVPHWSAVVFICPMIVMLYIDFLGALQFFGVDINGIFYFCVLVSIGLMVDFLLHVLMRYYESSPHKTRDERVKETLETMGTSIVLGGFTTFLGVVPLCLSATKIFMIVFLSFFAMVTLGVAHGLVLLPVVLSLVGPKSGLVSPGNALPRKEDANEGEDRTRGLSQG